MSETKHTPGPWLESTAQIGHIVIVGPEGDPEKPLPEHSIAYNSVRVAMHYRAERGQHFVKPDWMADYPVISVSDFADSEYSLEQVKANMRLICAAPDLLAACQNAIDRGVSHQVEMRLRAAIAKAEGTTP